MISAFEALQQLKEGNQQFMTGIQGKSFHPIQQNQIKLVRNQKPIAIILGCSDSRVPAEIVFNQGLGDLFVIRVAGNIVAPSQVGSIEFAAERFGTKLVVVLGHTECGAIDATIQELRRPSENRSPNLHAIVSRVIPAVETLLESNLNIDEENLMKLAVRSNIRTSVNQLRHGSQILEKLIDESGLYVVGAEYSIETGQVNFLDNIIPN